ncbi:MAG: hypothetical protein HY719_04485 [Planctomycetes bacterium]|nr:hypothetical protein [Planctomycetota bacterium]
MVNPVGFNVSAAAVDILHNFVRKNGASRQSDLAGQFNVLQMFNAARGDPSGLAVTELVNISNGALNQLTPGGSMATNILNLAAQGLNTVTDELVNLQDLAISAARLGGPLSDAQKLAVNNLVEQALARINQAVTGATALGTPLLGSPRPLQIGSKDPLLAEVTVESATFSGDVGRYALEVRQTAERARSADSFGDQAAGATIRVTGATGAAPIDIPAGALVGEVAARINVHTAETGVRAVVEGGTAVIESVVAGGAQSARLETLAGAFTNVAGQPFTASTARGQNLVALFDGIQQQTDGPDRVLLNGEKFVGAVTVSDAAVPGLYRFTVVGDEPAATSPRQNPILSRDARLRGLVNSLNATPEALGLESLRGGGKNSIAENPEGAIQTIASALGKVQTQAAVIGDYSGGLGTSLVGDSFTRNAAAGLLAFGGLSARDAADEVARSAFLLKTSLTRISPALGPAAKLIDLFF